MKECFEADLDLGNKNPAKYIAKLEEVRQDLRTKYSYERTDEDIIDQVIKVVGKEYEYTIEEIKSDRRRNRNSTLEQVKEAFNERYLKLKRERENKKKSKKKGIKISEDSSADSSEEDDKGLSMITGKLTPKGGIYNIQLPMEALGLTGMDQQQSSLRPASYQGQTNFQGQQPYQRRVTFQGQQGYSGQQNYQRFIPFTRQFKGLCNHCGVQGHKAADCPNKQGGGGKAEEPRRWNNAICPHCNKDTHPADRCWELEKNASFRPPNWVSVKTNLSARWNQDADGANARIQELCRHCQSP